MLYARGKSPLAKTKPKMTAHNVYSIPSYEAKIVECYSKCDTVKSLRASLLRFVFLPIVQSRRTSRALEREEEETINEHFIQDVVAFIYRWLNCL